MYAVCLGYANNRHDAKDILQDGFIKVFNSLKQFRGEGSFEGWIRRTVVNTAIDYYRRTLKHNADVNIDEAWDIPFNHSILGSINEKELLALVRKLPAGARIIFNLYVIEGYSHREIAEKLGINEGTSKSQFARARHLLQQWVVEVFGARDVAFAYS